MKTDTDPKHIEAFLARGVENVFPSKESFARALASGRQITVYMGIDPTGPTLHMGHAIPLMKLGALQAMGHEVIMLIGDFTAMIGDPSDKLAARKPLTRKQVLENCKLYKKQASRFISFRGKNAARIVFNSKWLAKMSFGDVVELASHMTVDQMLKRDMFRARMDSGKPVFLHEFLYPLMQGYDSVALDTDAEIGGNDQTFNMLTGRDLMKDLKGKEKFVIATKLLVDPTGKKMGKSEGNMITMIDSATDMLGKVMSWPDSLIISGLELCTTVPDEAIAKERAFLAGAGNPRDAKMRLASAVVEIYHGKDAAENAKTSFVSAFSSGQMPAEAREVSVDKGTPLIDVLVSNGVYGSRSLFKRGVTGGSIKNLKTGDKITTFDFKIESDLDIRAGQHEFLKIRIRR
ncbi:MAG: tyrosine--tRNA ligase [Patescibacteria group bacterium]|nr:tyrosine--tRNA ligase [Patescibacteria group bacterium]MDE2116829.1 tyrosine--tRNA ligase [Patescibacteria group bacterium]